MVIRTYFDRNNTIVKDSKINTGMNPITQLYYGGDNSEFTRFIFQFDTDRLTNLHNDYTYPDLTKLRHTLKMTNTGAFDTSLLGKTTCDGKERTCSFDLILFKVNEEWDEGCGYDYGDCMDVGETAISFSPSNWLESRTNTEWVEGPGVYSASTTVYGTQHFEQGNENLEIDVTDIVNGYITGDTNNGMGIAFRRSLEETPTNKKQYVGFFTRHTQTFYEPFIETIYDDHIKDDRNNFYLDKENKLYLYVNLGGTPTNLDEKPGVIVKDGNGDIFETYSSNDVEHVTKGVYAINIKVPTDEDNQDCIEFTDKWTNIKINGVIRPDIELNFIMKDSMGYYNIGDNDMLPKRIGFNVTGIKRDERIYRGDIRKVLVSTRIPYTIEQTLSVDNLKYRLYVKEGRNEYTVIDFQDVEIVNNINYFLLDTQSLVPGIYYLDVKVESNLEVSTTKDVLKFEIVSQSDLRISQ